MILRFFFAFMLPIYVFEIYEYARYLRRAAAIRCLMLYEDYY